MVLDCYSFGCLCKKYKRSVFWLIKNTLAILNLTSGLYFLRIMNLQKISEGSFSKKVDLKCHKISTFFQNNLLVLCTILTNFLFDLLPGLVSFVLPKVTTIDLNDYIGSYSRFLTSFEALLSALIYERIIRNRATKNKIISIISKSTRAPATIVSNLQR